MFPVLWPAVSGPTHEDPLLVLLPLDANTGQELAAFCADEVIRHIFLPPVWALDTAGVDLTNSRPDLRAVTEENLPDVTEALTRLCDTATLDRLVALSWAEVDEMVRDHYLKRNTVQTFAAIFKLAPRSLDREPPPAFRDDRVHEHGLEIQYRLAAEDMAPSPIAPPQEGSLVYYPFDPQNAEARAEGHLGAGSGVVLEAFAYGAARALHRNALERIGRDRGWRVIDPGVEDPLPGA